MTWGSKHELTHSEVLVETSRSVGRVGVGGGGGGDAGVQPVQAGWLDDPTMFWLQYTEQLCEL